MVLASKNDSNRGMPLHQEFFCDVMEKDGFEERLLTYLLRILSQVQSKM